MTITVYFVTMPGPKQVTEISFRIDTEDFLDAVAQATEQAKTITTVAIERIHITK